MHRKSFAHKKYDSAKYRFLKPLIEDFFLQTLSHHFPPILREKLVEELIKLLNKYTPDIKILKPGQILWTALDKNTRADSPNRKFVPVILTIVSQRDVEKLSEGISVTHIVEETIARIIREAYEQGGILSNRDVSLLILRSCQNISSRRISYEKKHNCILPHTGALHDMGTTTTHKRQIIQKVFIKKKDPADVAKECNHSQKAVDNYLKNYNRVKIAYKKNKDIQFVSTVTGISKSVVKEYLEILKNE